MLPINLNFLVNLALNLALKIHQKSTQEAPKINKISIKNNIQEIHSRITTNYKELTVLIKEHNLKDEERFHKLKSEFSSRVGILEKWRWIIIGGSIVAGFILHKFIQFAI